jgi:hypothetical protein
MKAHKCGRSARTRVLVMGGDAIEGPTRVCVR